MKSKEIISTLLNGDFINQVEVLSYLCDLYESYNKNIDEFEQTIEFLINLSFEINNDKLKDEILETICKATIYQDIEKINFDKIEANLNNVSIKFLPRYIDILSYSNNRKYLTTIMKYANYEDRDVRQSVQAAINELGSN